MSGTVVVVSVLAGLAVGVVVTVVLQASRVDAITRTVAGWIDTDGSRAGLPAHRGALGRLVRRLAVLGDEQDRLREQSRAPAWQRQVVSSLAGPGLLFDADGMLIIANDAARELFRHPEGQQLSAVQALGSAVLVAAVHDVHLSRGAALQVSAEVDDRYVVASVSPVGDDVLVIATDRSEERRVEELRRNFVVNASHELKTPATAIHTLSEALAVAVERQPDRVGALVSRLQVESERLGSMVHDLLNLRRLEDTGTLTKADVDLAAAVRSLVSDLQHRAETRRVTITVNAPDRLMVLGDLEDLALALRNLLANAIQYNREGGTVTVDLVPSADGCRVVITDTGIGIPQQDLSKIFERFYRVDVARSRETGGTGLGLSIVRHVIERHGGSIAVDSLLGQGTTFTVWLPTA